MKTTPTDPDKIDLQTTIDAALIELSAHEATSTEYATILSQIEKLYTIQNDSHKSSKKGVSPDTWVQAGVSITGILMILSFEHIGPVTSKAISFVSKAKI